MEEDGSLPNFHAAAQEKESAQTRKWRLGAIDRLRFTLNPSTGVDIVESYDVIFNYPQRHRSKDVPASTAARAEQSEVAVSPSRVKASTALPLWQKADVEDEKEGDSEDATAAGLLKTRMTRGTSAAGSSLPGSKVIADFGNDGLFSGTVVKASAGKPGYFLVRFHDGQEDDIQWFEIVRMQSERPVFGAAGYLLSMEAPSSVSRKDDARASRYGWVKSEVSAHTKFQDAEENVSILQNSKEATQPRKDSPESDDDDDGDGKEDFWVQCELCEKWRKVMVGADAAVCSLVQNASWSCRMNISDSAHNKCADPEESWGDDSGSAEDDDGDGKEDFWVQCESCEKWRKVMVGVDAATSSQVQNARWYCCMNSSDLAHNTCADPEESWDDDSDSAEDEGDKNCSANPEGFGVNGGSDIPTDESMSESTTATSSDLSEGSDRRLAAPVHALGLTQEQLFLCVQAQAANAVETESSRRSRRDLSQGGLDAWRCAECGVSNAVKNRTCFKCAAGNPVNSSLQKAKVTGAVKPHSLRGDRPKALHCHEEKEAEEEDADDHSPLSSSSSNSSSVAWPVAANVGLEVRFATLPDLVVSFSLFDAGGTSFPYYRLCAVKGVAILAKALRRCNLDEGCDDDDNSDKNEKNIKQHGNSKDSFSKSSKIDPSKKKQQPSPQKGTTKDKRSPRRVRFVAHVDHLVDDFTLRQLYAAARGRLRVVRYSTSQKDYSKTCWLISSMRYRSLWETKGSETVVSLDIHDDSSLQLRQIARLEKRLYEEKKQVAITYWRAGGDECENESALPLTRLGVSGCHAHTDGGLLVWRADDLLLDTCPPPAFTGAKSIRSYCCGGGSVSASSGETASRSKTDADAEAPGSVLCARRAIVEGSDDAFVEFVCDAMARASHNRIRGCDEMLLDAYLKDVLSSKDCVFQKHAHRIRSTPTHLRKNRAGLSGKKKKENGRQDSGGGMTWKRDGDDRSDVDGDSDDFDGEADSIEESQNKSYSGCDHTKQGFGFRKRRGGNTPARLVVSWVHMDIGDGRNGPPMMCCPEEQQRKKYRNIETHRFESSLPKYPPFSFPPSTSKAASLPVKTKAPGNRKERKRAKKAEP